ncbi:hypothetical protein Pst134EA_022898 [Puccinia striiformis f. sp. tritici]|uniref:hypothetical protein n=1 Tax=Puccinia striiformis f. sp. tritici TaxID=168172 RepID=UPI00200884A7|nr:hypothetical protein Pst134EA_022898 [Puccinia striiformis f. sp. tritici]KAH9455433.1 hypothetical protein Pst134EA_022898 [Puccinia striiformis f. sp. tritici]
MQDSARRTRTRKRQHPAHQNQRKNSSGVVCVQFNWPDLENSTQLAAVDETSVIGFILGKGKDFHPANLTCERYLEPVAIKSFTPTTTAVIHPFRIPRPNPLRDRTRINTRLILDKQSELYTTPSDCRCAESTYVSSLIQLVESLEREDDGLSQKFKEFRMVRNPDNRFRRFATSDHKCLQTVSEANPQTGALNTRFPIPSSDSSDRTSPGHSGRYSLDRENR